MSGRRTGRQVILCVGLPGCAWLFHQPRPDADMPAGARPWDTVFVL